MMQRCEAVLIEGLSSDEFWPSMHAAEALTAMGRRDLVLSRLTPLLPQTADPQHRVGIARELVRAGDSDKLELIVAALRDPASTARVHAAETLFKLGEVGDAAALRAAMQQDNNTGLRAFAAAALVRAGESQAEALAVLHELLNHEQASTRRYAMFCVGLLRDQSALDLLNRHTERSDIEQTEAMLCLQAFVLLGDEQGLAGLAPQLTHENASIRASAAMTTGLVGHDTLRPALIELLNDPVLDVRIRAAHALILLDHQTAAQSKTKPDTVP